jgi:hypothetical protein
MNLAVSCDMGTHMKTTIEIADILLAAAKKVAAREHTTVRALVEAGLRQELQARTRRQIAFSLKLVTAGGQGLLPGVSPDLPRALAYDLPETDP